MEQRFPPRTVRPGPPKGQDYFTLSANHGRPTGRFERWRPPRKPAVELLNPKKTQEFKPYSREELEAKYPRKESA